MATFKFDIERESELRANLAGKGFEFVDFAHAFWRAKTAGVNVTFYKSGKLLVQGKASDSFIDDLINSVIISSGNSEEIWMGTDESGKGDYFGPLVFAGAVVKKEYENELLRAGINDSKTLTDKKVAELTVLIKTFCPYSVVAISPVKYNELILKMKNLNKIMGWGHARVIENILEKVSCPTVISDKFGNDKFIVDSLQERGQSIKLIQRHKAESDLAVAAASILARDTFVKKMADLSKKYNIQLPKGANNHVVDVGRTLVKRYGKQELKQIAKLHFRTTQSVFAE